MAEGMVDGVSMASRYVQLLLNANKSRPAVEAMQRRKFKRLLRHVSAASPYYAGLIRERGIDIERARPQDFPVLTKSILAERFDDIVTRRELSEASVERFLASSQNPRELMDGRYVVVHSSGTSGAVGLCVYTLQEWLYGWLTVTRAVGARLPMRVAYFACVEGHFAGASLASTSDWLPRRWQPLRHLIRSELFDLTAPRADTLKRLNALNPTVLVTYGSSLNDLAAAQQAGELCIHPRRIVYGGDRCDPQDRVMARQAFGAPVWCLYAATETLAIGLGWPDGNEIVLLEDDLIIEVMDDHILVTNLFNGTTPMIRYQVTDVVVPVEDTGRPRRYYPGFRRVKGLVGRSDEKLCLQNEDGVEGFINPILLRIFFVEGIRNFRFVRHSDTHCILQAVLASNLSAGEVQRVLSNAQREVQHLMARHRMRNVTCEVQVMKALPIDPITGKRRRVVQESALSDERP